MRSGRWMNCCIRATRLVDADLSKYFDTIPHSELMPCVARRIVDKHMLHLNQNVAESAGRERDEKGKKRLTGGRAMIVAPRKAV